MIRKPQNGTVKHNIGSTSDPLEELKSQAPDDEFIILAHLNAGIRWGICQNRQLALAPDFPKHAQPEFSIAALQQLRVFNAHFEFFAWRKDDHSFGWRVIRDGEGEAVEYFDEDTLLWGTHVEARHDGFALLREGAQGMRHSPPLQLPENTWGGAANQSDGLQIQPARLVVRHYLNTGNTALVALSRPVKIKPLELESSEQKP